jgi:hypothetical protein
MKKKLSLSIILLTACIVSVLNASAQYAKKGDKVYFGLSGGVDFCSFNGTFTGNFQTSFRHSGSNTYGLGFNIGINAQIPFAPEFYIVPQLSLAYKHSGLNLNDTDRKFNTSYIQLPIYIMYKSNLGIYNVNLIIGAGPFIGYGLGGKVKEDGNTSDIKFSNTVLVNSNTVYFQNPDGGAAFLLGLEFANRISCIVNANLGLLNIQTGIDNSHLRNINFGLGVGYRFK